jgi:hypothetical protein
MLKMPHTLMQIKILDRRTLYMEEIAYPVIIMYHK